MDEKAMAVYRDLLVEIKYRTGAIDDILAKEVKLRAKIAEEFCYLQLRMICELIAIGCLIINSEISAKKSDLLKSYKADHIMKEMEKLHPKFYPDPLESEDIIDSKGARQWVHKKSGFLARQDLANLWSRCGGKLHRGSARNVLKVDSHLTFSEVKNYRDKIVGLLNKHIINSPDEEHICYFIMNDGHDHVHSALFESLIHNYRL